MKTIVYIDGFNLYYRMLKGSNFKWLNLQSLCENSLPAGHKIETINYYTARVSSRVSELAPRRQQIYFNALKTIPNLSIHQGRFQVKETFMFLADPLQFRPPVKNITPKPKFANVVKTEEKGSDVNLGVHIIRDGFQKKYDHAVVLTNDTDLEEPLRIVQEELNLPVTLLSPVKKAAESLNKRCTSVIYLTDDHLSKSQFEHEFTVADGKIIKKPESW